MRLPGPESRRPGAWSAALFTALCSATVFAAEPGSRAGHGSVTLGYQYVAVDGFEGALGNVPLGEIQTHALSIDVDFHLTDRVTLVAGIPYIRERYLGPFDHDPTVLDTPRPNAPNVDLGQWNDDFQDFHFGVRYLWRDAPLSIEPYAIAGIPSNYYPFFGHAAIGRNRAQIEFGSSFVYTPPISDAYYRLNIGYAFVERTLGVAVDHLNVFAEAGYFLSPRLSLRAFLSYRDGRGVNFPTDFPPPAERTNEFWYQHDRLVKHNFTNVGAGLSWAFDERFTLTSSVFTMARANQIHDVEYALSVALTRSF